MTKPNCVTQRSVVSTEADVLGCVMQAYSILNENGVEPVFTTEVATVISELAMNIVKYANGQGSILFEFQQGSDGFAKVIAQDCGPGILNIQEAMQDHFSSKGSLGVGLPGVRRMVDDFDLKSSPGIGTKVSVTKWFKNPADNKSTRVIADSNISIRELGKHKDINLGLQRVPDLEVSKSLGDQNITPKRVTQASKEIQFATVNRPCYGELGSGDITFLFPDDEGILFGIIDVLGHGLDAYELAVKTRKFIEHCKVRDVTTLIGLIHKRFFGDRGAAMTIGYLSKGKLTVQGVGNTTLIYIDEVATTVMAQPGIVGGNLPKLRPISVSVGEDTVFILFSDGISDHIESRELQNMKYWSVNRIAAEFLNRFGKVYDDASCLVLRY